MRNAWSPRRFVAFLMAALLGVAGIAVSTPAIAQDALSVTISPAAGFAVAEGQGFKVTITVSNDSKNTVQATKAIITARSNLLGTITALDEWFAEADGTTQPGWVLTTLALPELTPGQSLQQTVAVDLNLAKFGQAWGPRGIAVDVVANNASVAHNRSSLLWTTGSASATPVAASLVFPIVAPSSSSGLIGVAELTELTSATGSLTQQLAVASGRAVVLAVDPRITTSIAALGSSAPESVASWLARLKTLPNESFELAYGDADLAGQLQAGSPTLVNPATTDLTASGNRPAATATPSSDSTSAPAPAPNAQAAPLARVWSPSISGFAWPAANSLVAANIAAITANGYNSLLVADANIETRTGRPATVSLGSTPALVANDGLSDGLNSALWGSAPASGTSKAAAYLAAGALDPGTAGRIIGTLPRRAFIEGAAAAATSTLDALSSQAWVSMGGISSSVTSGGAAATVRNTAESSERITQIQALQTRLAAIGEFSSISSNPGFITNPAARALAATLSVSWLETGNWATGVSGYLSSTGKTLGSVEVVTSSEINMVGGQANIPVAVHNALTEPVTVRVQAKSSNARLAVTGDATITIQPDSQGKALIPVEARVSTGSALLEVTLFSPSGVVVGAPASIPINVRADWEAWGLGAFALAFVGLVSAGIVRTLRRRRSRAGE